MIVLLLLTMAAVVPSVFADTSIVNIYDANGSLITGDGRYYEYNDANQLVRVRQGDTIAGPVISEYFYDASGQRVKKIENGVVTYYVGKHFEKQVGGPNAGNTSYYFGDGGERVAKKDPTGNIYYYHLDHLDGVNAVTDAAGTVVAKTDYLPFGDTRAGGTGSEKYAYTGKEQDKTSLYYFDARYNSPEFRHFTQADIAEPDYSDPQDLNRYSYVGNNPLSYVDPDGFKKQKKAKLSKREKRAVALGLNPDKDKYKVGKMSDREYKKALAAHNVASKPRNVAGGGSIYSLVVAGGGSIYSLVGVGSIGGGGLDTGVRRSYGLRSKSNGASPNWFSDADVEALWTAERLLEDITKPLGIRFIYEGVKLFGYGVLHPGYRPSYGEINHLLNNLPFGLDLGYKFGKYKINGALYSATDGKYGEAPTLKAQYELTKSLHGVGPVISAGEYLSKEVLGELLYENGLY